MKTLKTQLLLLLLFCSSGSIFAQDNLRDMVCIVRLQHTEEAKSFYSDYGRALSREGYMRAGAMLLARGNDGFGSGVVVEHQGKFYVLSNQHVVNNAQFVTLEFRTSADEVRKFENCLVVARDKNYDLALIAFPQNVGIQSGFVISDIAVREGMQVWSAGFPGLGNNPSWQLGNGIISNQSVRDSLITNDKLTFVIQHTAQVDAGSSGGALLVVSSNEQLGYSLIGINTWKARGRENANFAIPTSAIQSFLASTQETVEVKTTDRQQVERLTKQLLEARNAENYKTILPFISENFIFSVPVAVFNDLLSDASTVARTDARTAFRDVEPFDAFRIVIADALYGRLQRTVPIFGTVKVGSSDVRLISTFTLTGKEIVMEWALEDGEWLLIKTNLLDERNRARVLKTHATWSDVSKARYIGVGKLLDAADAPLSLSLVLEGNYSKFFTGFSELTVGQQFMTEEDDDMIIEPTELHTYFAMNFGLQVQYPMSFQSFPIQTIPFIKIPAGGYLGGKDGFGYILGFRPGVRFAYHLGQKNRHIFIDLEYRYNYFIIPHPGSSPTEKFSNSMLGISLGFAY